MMWYGIFAGYAAGSLAGLFFLSSFVPDALWIVAIAMSAVWWRESHMRIMAVTLCAFAFGFMHANESVRYWHQEKTEKTITGKATVMSEPETKARTQEVILKFTECFEGECPSNFVAGFVSVYETVHYGDTVFARCELTVPSNEGLDFDYAMYSAMRGIAFVCYPKEWRIENSSGGNVIVRSILHARVDFERRLTDSVGYPESGLGRGLLFGGNDYVTQDLKDEFSRTGLSHIVAVSGANVVIIARCFFLIALAIGLWRRQAIVLSVLGIVGFVLMTGASASAVRAGIMGILVLTADYGGRRSNGVRLLAFALAVMAWWNPLSLRYDLGLQLSFLAALGILIGVPAMEILWEKYCSRISMPDFLREILLMTVAAEWFVLPIIVYTFHTVPIISLVANMCVLPFIPAAMALSFMTIVMSFFSLSIANAVGALAFAILSVMLSAVHILASLPYASVSVEVVSLVSIGAWYGFLALGIGLTQKYADGTWTRNDNG